MPSLIQRKAAVAAELQALLESFGTRRHGEGPTGAERARVLQLRADLALLRADETGPQTVKEAPMGTISEQREWLQRLKGEHARQKRQAEQYLQAIREDGRDTMTAREAREFKRMRTDLEQLTERIEHEKGELGRLGQERRPTAGRADANTHAHAWASMAAERMMGTFGEHRAVVSGSIDVPSLVLPYVVETPWPTRLIDLLVNRQVAESNAFEYFTQTVRTNNAAPVADLASKPTSVFTLQAHTDRCRVVAHLSQPVPYRYLMDQPQLQSWLVSEMYQGVMAGLEAQIISGSGSGENMLGLLNASGTTAVAFDTDALTTIRHSITELQLLGEVPNGIALNPVDAEGIDLTRWGADGGFLSGGFQHDAKTGFGTSDNVFGPTNDIRRVISPSVPQGTAIVADWSQLKIFVREDFTLLMNYLGDTEFQTNSYVLRGEGRYGIGLLRAQAFAIADLTA